MLARTQDPVSLENKKAVLDEDREKLLQDLYALQNQYDQVDGAGVLEELRAEG